MNESEYIDDKKRRRARVLCSVMEGITGVDPTSETRQRLVVTSRAMVAQMMLIEGWTEHQAGNALGWDHSTIHHYHKKFVDMMTTPGYEKEREIWAKFILSI